MSNGGWIGFDLDGTLAEYHGFKGVEHIGEPIPAMVAKAREFIDAGIEVRIMTARVDGGSAAIHAGNGDGEAFRDVERVRRIIQDWTEKHIGVRLPVTNIKDYSMWALYDDRAVAVEKNTGRILGGEVRP